MNKTVTQSLLAMPVQGSGKQQFLLKLSQILATAILELTAFEQIPDPFLRIELGCIGRQTLQVNACSSALLAPGNL
ncbi:hypothetical protein KSB_47670 [Ktedonobacter robiniae]|uniref:Uncharacterized protein n=1 Tax=Ktedonobacter robiniae TaxID=2778365 RepID=A0ABQ3UV72_9CHLR|nr:hypothetical protein KSB_47670 [Ktedonobacter robiniae]